MIPIRYCYADQFGGQKVKNFKYKQLKNYYFPNHICRLKRLKTKLKQSIEYWRGDLEQVDDICVIGIKI